MNDNSNNTNTNGFGSVSLGNIESNPNPMLNQANNLGATPNPMPDQVNNLGATPNPMPDQANNLGATPSSMLGQANNLGSTPSSIPDQANNVGVTSNLMPEQTNNLGTTSINNFDGSLNNNVEPVSIESISSNNNFSNNVGLDPVNNVNMNGFVETSKQENIGTMPPENKPKKKPMNKVLFIILILLLMAGIAFGVYYLLKISKDNQIKVELKDNIVLPLGEPVSTNINDYAVIKGTDNANCTLITSSIDVNNPGEYDFIIKCNNKDYHGKVVVKDSVSPVVSLKVVYKTENEKYDIDVNEFIDSCKDASECIIEYKDKKQLDNLAMDVPNYIDIVVKDKGNNETDVKGVLYILSNDIKAFLSCDSAMETLNDGNVEKTIRDELGMVNTDNGVTYLNVGRRDYIYKFKNQDEYSKIAKNKSALLKYDGNEGLAYYDDENQEIIISTDLSKATLNSEFGGEFPNDYNQIKDYYRDKKYICKIASK